MRLTGIEVCDARVSVAGVGDVLVRTVVDRQSREARTRIVSAPPSLRLIRGGLA